ncbi:MAG: FumA C-terminus/TtdB family hydratase beta subunit [Pseudomonadota bacterium]
MSSKHWDIFDFANAKSPEWRKIEQPHSISVKTVNKQNLLCFDSNVLRHLSKLAFFEINHYLRTAHLKQLANIMADEQASANDKHVAFQLLKNANIAASGIFPMCQDTGTAIVLGKKGRCVLTHGKADQQAISEGIEQSYLEHNLRYSQVSALSMFEEKNTGNNLPAQIEIMQEGREDEYKFLFIAKGGGSANKSFLFQNTPSYLEKKRMMDFLEQKIRSIGTSACPPYHLAVVIGGLSAELTMKTVKMASTGFLDHLPETGNDKGKAWRDRQMENELLSITQNLGIGAQFGGRYFCHDIRVIRLPRHGASLPIGIGVSCSADRQILAKINSSGVFIERLEHEPAQFIPEIKVEKLTGTTQHINLNQPMQNILNILDQCKVTERLSLSGTMIVARDSAHRKIREKIANGSPMPDYFKNHPIYYAGPAKTPEGHPSGSFGPTTAGRMDSFVDEFQALGGSMIMLAKGNRSPEVRKACKRHGGFYLGSIGGPAALLGRECIKKIEVIDYPELGMEAVWRIEVEQFPAFIVVDNKGNDFFAGLIDKKA